MAEAWEKIAILEELIAFSEHSFRMRRKNPELTEEQEAALVRAWYKDRPGAENGDGEGTPIDVAEYLKRLGV